MIQLKDFVRSVGVSFAMSVALIPTMAISGPDVSASIPAGIRHSVEVSIGVEPGPEQPLGSLSIAMNISSHAKQVDFSKSFNAVFQDVDLNKGAPFQKVWEETQCHERRGYPRIWLDGVKGSVTTDGVKTGVEAIPRHLGLHLPKDELQPGQQVFADGNDLRHERVYRSKTLASHLRIDVRLISVACEM